MLVLPRVGLYEYRDVADAVVGVDAAGEATCEFGSFRLRNNDEK
jgi:hypothetical protein